MWLSSNNFSWTKCFACEAQFMLRKFFSCFLCRTWSLEKLNPTCLVLALQYSMVNQFLTSTETMFWKFWTTLVIWIMRRICGSEFWKHYYRINGNQRKKPSEEVNWKEVCVNWDPYENCDFKKNCMSHFNILSKLALICTLMWPKPNPKKTVQMSMKINEFWKLFVAISPLFFNIWKEINL